MKIKVDNNLDIPCVCYFSDDIRSKITSIKCSDGSTNLKGVYVVNDLVVIKYNEVEDWEALGFPEGSISKGIDAYGYSVQGDKEFKCDVNTGNIKFIAHALDYENQLSNFDAFVLPDSDALLSVSYTERPESKYRLFRPQGVLLTQKQTGIQHSEDFESHINWGIIHAFVCDIMYMQINLTTH